MQNLNGSSHGDARVVVVGGGLAGLTAAAYLARGGANVTLFEKASNLGGRAATRENDGFRFNRGIHAIYTGGAAAEVLEDLGIAYTTGGSPKKGFVLDHGRLRALPIDPISPLTSDLFSMGDKVEFARLSTGLSRIDPRSLAIASVQEWLDRSIRRPRVRRVMASLARVFVYSAALDVVSAEVFIKRLQTSLKHPVHYVDGGWQTLVDGLRRTAEQSSARIVSCAGVAAVEHDGTRVRGVRMADGSSVSASAVVVATAPHEAAKLVDDGTHPALRRIVDALVPAQVACLDVALRRLPQPRYAATADLDRPLFYSAQSLYSRVAPEGAALVCAFKQLDPRHPTDPRDDERELEELLDAAQSGWRDLVVKRVYLPRIAAAGTLPTADDGGYAGRPGSAVPGLQNLYLAGDWIEPEGFLSDASFASAREVARVLLGNRTRSTEKKSFAMAVPR